MSLFETFVFLYMAALFIWVQHLMLKQNRDDREQRAYLSEMRADLMKRIETLKRVCELQQSLIEDRDSTLTILDDTGRIPDDLWNQPYKRKVMGGMYEKDSDTGAVTERRQDDE